MEAYSLKESDLKLEDFIVVLPNAIDNKLCDEIVKTFEKSKEWDNAACGPDSGYHPEVRNCNIIDITHPKSEKFNTKKRQKIDAKLFDAVSSSVRTYIEKHPRLSFINSDEGYQLMRYKVGERVTNHIDVGNRDHRVLTCSIQLNDSFKGGEWIFFGDTKIKVNKGDAVLFPSNFCFDHEVTEITEGIRYSVLTFLTCR